MLKDLNEYGRRDDSELEQMTQYLRNQLNLYLVSPRTDFFTKNAIKKTISLHPEYFNYGLI